MILTVKKTEKLLHILQVKAKKDSLNCNLLSEWVLTKIKGKSIEDYLKCKGYYVTAIYGMNYIGEFLLKDLSNGTVKVEYAIDRRAEKLNVEAEVLKPDAWLPEVDVIIVTTRMHYEEIQSNLKCRVQCPIILLDDILHELLLS